MTAILGLDGDTIARICEEADGEVSVANYNCPGQTVITGEKADVYKRQSFYHMVQRCLAV